MIRQQVYRIAARVCQPCTMHALANAPLGKARQRPLCRELLWKASERLAHDAASLQHRRRWPVRVRQRVGATRDSARCHHDCGHRSVVLVQRRQRDHRCRCANGYRLAAVTEAGAATVVPGCGRCRSIYSDNQCRVRHRRRCMMRRSVMRRVVLRLRCKSTGVRRRDISSGGAMHFAREQPRRLND
jgi:hypothetical protein